MPLWKDEAEKFRLIKEKLYTPVVGDILDAMGYTHQFLPPEIRPLREEMKLAGRAMTVLMIDVFGPQEKPFGLLTEALDQLRENEIYLATGGTGRCAYWGGTADCYRPYPRRSRRSRQRLPPRHPASARAALAGVLPRRVGAGFLCAHAGRGFSLPD